MPFHYPLPRSLTSGSIRTHAPAASGIFGISNSRTWLYIGETDDIQKALLGYLARLDVTPREQATGFVYEECDRSNRLARQDQLVAEYEPSFNRNLSRRTELP